MILLSTGQSSTLESLSSIDHEHDGTTTASTLSTVSSTFLLMSFCFLVSFFLIATYAQAMYQSMWTPDTGSHYVRTDEHGAPQNNNNQTLPLSLSLPNVWEFLLYLQLCQSLSIVSFLPWPKLPRFFLHYCDDVFSIVNFTWASSSGEDSGEDSLGLLGYANRLGRRPLELFYPTIVLFLAIVGLVLVLALLCRVSSHIKDVHHPTKFIYVSRSFCALALGFWALGCFPIALHASFHLRLEHQVNLSWAGAAGALLGVCIGLLGLTSVKILRRESASGSSGSSQELRAFRHVWGVLYETLEFSKRGYVLVVIFIDVTLGIVLSLDWIDHVLVQYFILLGIHLSQLVLVRLWAPASLDGGGGVYQKILESVQATKVGYVVLLSVFLPSSSLSSAGCDIIAWILLSLVVVGLSLMLLRHFVLFYGYVAELCLVQRSSSALGGGRLASSSSSSSASGERPMTPQRDIVQMI